MTLKHNPMDRLRHHVTGAIERGEAIAIVEQRAKHSPEIWAVNGEHIETTDADGFTAQLFTRWHATDDDMHLAARAPALLAALAAVLEHCALIHKHWGDGDNSQQAAAAETAARKLLERLS